MSGLSLAFERDMPRVTQRVTSRSATRMGRVVASRAPWAALGLAVLQLGPLGCKGTVNDRQFLVEHGPPGAVPLEAVAAASSNAPLPGGKVPDPCRGIPLPVDQHYVADGLCARLVAKNQGAVRELTFMPNGDLLAVTRTGTIRRYRDLDGNGVFDGPEEVVDWATTGGDNGQNCDLFGAYLYCGSQDGVKRWRYGADLAKGGSPEDVMTGQPGGGNHPFHPLHVYDGYLYVDSGSERNTLASMPDDYITDRAVLKRFSLAAFLPGQPLAWDRGEVVVRGARNVTGFTRDAKGRMYGVLNGFDDMRFNGEDIHADNPGEYVVQLEPGQAYGWPFCFAAERVVMNGAVVPPGTPLHAEEYKDLPLNRLVESSKDDAWCQAHMTRPMSFIEAHSAPLDIVIDEGPDGALPARWKGGAFISTHGSWDRNPSTGYKVVWLPLDANGRAPMPVSTATTTQFPYEVVFGGGGNGVAKDGEWGWSEGGLGEGVVRPVGVAISPVDGALYVASDDQAVKDHPGKMPNAKGQGAIYRIGARRVL